MDVVTSGLWKGCLGGIGLAIVFFIISGLTYLILTLTDVPRNIVLFITIASGPVIGTFGLAAVLLMRARNKTGTGG